jgi:kynureninase
MDLSTLIERLRGDQAQAQAAKLFPADANTLAYAQHLDAQDELKHLRSEFILPTKGSIRKKALDGTIPGEFLSLDTRLTPLPHTRRGLL